MTSLKKHLKNGIRLIIECDANPTTIIMRISKKQLINLLEKALPEDPTPKH